MSFAEKIKAKLLENKMTKAELAKDAGIPYTTLDSMLKRETDTERLATVFRIARALGTSVEELVFDEAFDHFASPEEKRVLALYSLLDSRGKNTVLSLLEKEADYIKKSESIFLPVFSAPAAAGEALPILSEEKEMMPFSEKIVPKGAEFVLRISGDSMQPLYFDGDFLFVAPSTEIKNGEIGIFVLNGEALCKMYSSRNGECSLVSLNPKYEPIPILNSDEMVLMGKVLPSRS
jgi:SOS-response transcriptional repressor LexA